VNRSGKPTESIRRRFPPFRDSWDGWKQANSRRPARHDALVPSDLDLIIGPVSTLVGVGLGYISSRAVSKSERDATSRADLRRAISVYLGALYPAVAQLRAMPDVRPGALADLLDRLRGETATYVHTQRQLAAMGSRHMILADQLVAAYAGLAVMNLPPRLRTAVDESFAWMAELGENRSEEVKARWPAIWAELDAAVKGLAANKQSPWRRRMRRRR
jgi:hypothetical protein